MKRRKDSLGKQEYLDPPLDTTIWQKLSQDLLEIILSKTPFPSLVRFLAVSKSWNLVIIPNAARRGQMYGRTVLLYFDARFTGDPREFGWYPRKKQLWLALGVLESVWQEFEPNSFLPLGLDDDTHLLASEGGLLFFVSHLIGPRHVLVLNPVTRKHRVLSPPSTLIPSEVSFGETPIAGVAFTAETGNYKLVVVGTLNTGEQLELLYDSITSSWKRVPLRRQVVGDHVSKIVFKKRGMCYNGHLYFSLYYFGKIGLSLPKAVAVKFDVQREIWTKVEELPLTQLPRSFDFCQMATENREDGLLIDMGSDLIMNLNRLGDWDPGRGTKDEVMSIKEVVQLRGFLEDYNLEDIEEECKLIEYFGFRQGDNFYHVLYIWEYPSNSGDTLWGSLRVVAHNTAEYSEPCYYQEDSLKNDLHACKVWAFTPSLTALV